MQLRKMMFARKPVPFSLVQEGIVSTSGMGRSGQSSFWLLFSTEGANNQQRSNMLRAARTSLYLQQYKIGEWSGHPLWALVSFWAHVCKLQPQHLWQVKVKWFDVGFFFDDVVFSLGFFLSGWGLFCFVFFLLVEF